jgi:hypothetical protein
MISRNWLIFRYNDPFIFGLQSYTMFTKDQPISPCPQRFSEARRIGQLQHLASCLADTATSTGDKSGINEYPRIKKPFFDPFQARERAFLRLLFRFSNTSIEHFHAPDPSTSGKTL